MNIEGHNHQGNTRISGEKIYRLSVILLILLVVTFSGCSEDTNLSGKEGALDMGVSFTPANLPNPSEKDIVDFFNKAKLIGDHVIFIVEWDSMPSLSDIKNIQTATERNGLKFHLQLSPISLYGGRKNPSIPAKIDGTGFKDDDVRAAFKLKALELASLEPDYLGLGTEVNLLAQNPEEFEQYVSLTRETYSTIKSQYPSQHVTISFQWDVLLTQKQFDILPQFKDSLDIYSFTTYPTFFKDPDKIPDDYYSSVRKLLPTQRIGFSEVGWNSGYGSTEKYQALYYARLPELMSRVEPEYVILALLHDVSLFTGELSSLNSVGIRYSNGTPKESWDVIVNKGKTP